jgi:hypothetical protein
MRALLAAFVLLVGISSTNAALCTETIFETVAVPTCDCPPGSGPSGSYSQALPVSIANSGKGYGGASDATTNALAKVNAALALCVDLLPGWKMAASAMLPVVCAIGATPGVYCTGVPAAFTSSTGNTAGHDVITATTAVDGAFTGTTTKDVFKVRTDSKILGSGELACDADAPNTGQTAPFTLDKCKVKVGYYVHAAADTSLVDVRICPAGSVCSTGQTGAQADYSPVSCIGGGNTAGIVGGFICPTTGTYGTLGTTLAASTAALTGKIMCGVGSGPKAGGITCDPLPGYYGATSAAGTGSPSTTPAQTACPTGITGPAISTTFVAGCVDLAAGYSVTAVPAQFVPGTITTLTAAIVPCPANKFCLTNAAEFAFVGASASLATYAAVVATAGAACPVGTGNALSASAAGANAVSDATGCIDLLPGYALAQSISDATLTDVVKICTGEGYGCGGSAGLFVDYSATGLTLDFDAVGLTNAANADLTHATGGEMSTAVGVKTSAAAVTAGSTLVKLACPLGSANAAFGGPISSCLTLPGKYVDHSDLFVTANCPAGEYCPGGAPMGTAGGNSKCPIGSDGPTASSVVNSNIADCTVSSGFYIASGALNTPVPCVTASICAGGGSVGTAGGSVACPTGSTNAACVSSTSTTVNLTPASQPITIDVAAPTAADSPAVTVTNTVPSASSAASTVASMVVVTVAAMVAL